MRTKRKYSSLGAEIAGCFFHLMRNFKKCLRKNNLYNKFTQEPQFAVRARSIISLVFVPPMKVWRYFEILSQRSPQELAPILQWFKDYYVGKQLLFELWILPKIYIL